jgi:hypothetical protein
MYIDVEKKKKKKKKRKNVWYGNVKKWYGKMKKFCFVVIFFVKKLECFYGKW